LPSAGVHAGAQRIGSRTKIIVEIKPVPVVKHEKI